MKITPFLDCKFFGGGSYGRVPEDVHAYHSMTQEECTPTKSEDFGPKTLTFLGFIEKFFPMRQKTSRGPHSGRKEEIVPEMLYKTAKI